MNVKTFQATDMKEALSKVKAEMGPDAVIISSRQIKKGSNAFGMFTRPLMEVTAAFDSEISATATANAAIATKPRKKATGFRRGERDRANLKRKTAAEKPRGLDVGTMMDAMSPLRTEIAELRELIAANQQADAVGKSELKKAANLTDELENMRSMMGMLIEQSGIQKGVNLETNYMLAYRRMVERGIESQYAMGLVNKVKNNVPGRREVDLRTIINEVMLELEDAMFVADPIRPYAAGPRLVSLIGPTGVGKTTTIAKIAAQLVMEGKKVGLITVDTFRIAAVEQLKIYAGIMNIPLEVVISPDDLKKALANYATKDVVLIDTAGRSQRDTVKIDELSSFLEQDETIETYLCMSAACEPAAIDEAVRNFGTIPLAGMIFTKMDETTRPGVVISQNFKTGLPIVYTTHGQKVPEDIETASAKRLALRLFKKEL